MNTNANSNKFNDFTNTKTDIPTNTDNNYVKPRLQEAYVDIFASTVEFYYRLNSAFIDALFVPFTDARDEIKKIKTEVMDDGGNLFFDYQKQQQLYNKTEKIILSKIRDKFDTNFREKLL